MKAFNKLVKAEAAPAQGLARDLTLRVYLIRDATDGTAHSFFGIAGYFEAA